MPPLGINGRWRHGDAEGEGRRAEPCEGEPALTFAEHRRSDEAAFAHRDHAAVARGLGHARADRALIERLAHQDDALRSVERHGSGMLGIDRGEQAAQVVDLDAADHDTGEGAVRVQTGGGRA